MNNHVSLRLYVVKNVDVGESDLTPVEINTIQIYRIYADPDKILFVFLQTLAKSLELCFSLLDTI